MLAGHTALGSASAPSLGNRVVLLGPVLQRPPDQVLTAPSSRDSGRQCEVTGQTARPGPGPWCRRGVALVRLRVRGPHLPK